jgi:3-hydroxybutyryl-CoA dehydrogenase
MTEALAVETVVGVVGAGTMGAGIAEVAAAAGHPVRLHDNRPGAAADACAALAARLAKRVARGKLSQADADALVARITPSDALADLAPAGLVVEAIVEELAVKRALFAELEALLAPAAILASNTSSLSITALAAGLARPERVVGMHFFNPVPVMALVEVVHGLASDAQVTATVLATARAWGKRAVRVASTPGFIVNRVARPFYAEALRLLQEGVADAATLDAVYRDAGGFRMGPFELMDLIGHDVNFAVTRSVFEAFFHDPRYRPSLLQQELVAAGRLGRKSGRGFYRYAADAARPEPADLAAASAPAAVAVHGDLGPVEPLVALIAAAGLTVDRVPAAGPGWIAAGRARLALSDGRSATARAVDDGDGLVLLDLALDYATAPRLAIAVAEQADAGALADAAGLLQALGKRVVRLADTPGLAVLRTVALLANEGAEAVLQQVCSAAAVDEAMRYGVNYPRGPLAWADAVGPAHVLALIDQLAAAYGEDRYRASPWLRQRVAAGRPLRDDQVS